MLTGLTYMRLIKTLFLGVHCFSPSKNVQLTLCILLMRLFHLPRSRCELRSKQTDVLIYLVHFSHKHHEVWCGGDC